MENSIVLSPSLPLVRSGPAVKAPERRKNRWQATTKMSSSYVSLLRFSVPSMNVLESFFFSFLFSCFNIQAAVSSRPKHLVEDLVFVISWFFPLSLDKQMSRVNEKRQKKRNRNRNRNRKKCRRISSLRCEHACDDQPSHLTEWALYDCGSASPSSSHLS
jgi:hypothetical protein